MQRNTSPVFRLLGTVFGLTLLVSLIVVILGSVFHWNTSVEFSNGFFAAGALVAAEAGASLRLPAGFGTDGELTVAAAPGIAEEFLAMLTEIGADAPITSRRG